MSEPNELREQVERTKDTEYSHFFEMLKRKQDGDDTITSPLAHWECRLVSTLPGTIVSITGLHLTSSANRKACK